MDSEPFCKEAACSRCAKDKVECKSDCLRALEHHKRTLYVEGRLLSKAEKDEVVALYDAYYSRHKQLLESK